MTRVVKDDNFGEGNIHLFKDNSGNIMVSSDLANYTDRNYQNTGLDEVHRHARKVAVLGTLPANLKVIGMNQRWLHESEIRDILMT